MYDEEKTLNFTTQNSFLHYGRKGMKWYKNIFGDNENFGTLKRNKTKIAYQARGGRQRSGEKPGYMLDTPTQNGSMPNTYPKTYEGQAQAMTDDYNKFAAYSKSNFNRQVKDSEDQMNRRIAEESQKTYDSAYDGIKKASEKLDKFVDAFDSIQDMDDKYTTKLYKKYIYDIAKASKDFNDSLKKVTSVIRKSNPELADQVENMYMLDTPKVDADPATIRGYMWNFTNKKEAAYRLLDEAAGTTSEIYGGGLNTRPGYSNDNKFLTTNEKADKYLNRKK